MLPCFLLSSPRFDFLIGFSLYLTLFPQQLSQSRSLFIQCSWLPSTRVNCIIIILYLASCSCIRVAVCLPMFFPNKTNINTVQSRSESGFQRVTGARVAIKVGDRRLLAESWKTDRHG